MEQMNDMKASDNLTQYSVRSQEIQHFRTEYAEAFTCAPRRGVIPTQ